MKGELIAIIGLLLTNAGFLFGMWKYFDTRITRMYARLDDVKDYISDKFVQKEICRVMHTNTSEYLLGVEKRISERFEQLEKKVDNSFTMILDLLKQR